MGSVKSQIESDTIETELREVMNWCSIYQCFYVGLRHLITAAPGVPTYRSGSALVNHLSTGHESSKIYADEPLVSLR